jgi:hypothetical protein
MSSYSPFQLDNGFLYYFPREFSTNGQLQKQLALGWEITPGDDPNVERYLHRAVDRYSWLVLADGSGISGPTVDHGFRPSPPRRAPGGTFAIEQKGRVVTVTDTSTNVGQPKNQTPIMFRPFSRHTPAESAMYSSQLDSNFSNVDSNFNNVAAAVRQVGKDMESHRSMTFNRMQGSPFGVRPPAMGAQPRKFALILRKKA